MNPLFYLDDETLKMAKECKLDKKLIRRCSKTKNSLEKEDVIYHRNLQTQIYSVTSQCNKNIRKLNNEIIHYGDKPTETLDNFGELKDKLKEKYKIN